MDAVDDFIPAQHVERIVHRGRGAFIVHNFRDEPVSAGVTLRAGVTGLTDLVSGEKVAVSERTEPARSGAPANSVPVATFTLAPHSFRALQIN